jgi:hypothetical protein
VWVATYHDRYLILILIILIILCIQKSRRLCLKAKLVISNLFVAVLCFLAVVVIHVIRKLIILILLTVVFVFVVLIVITVTSGILIFLILHFEQLLLLRFFQLDIHVNHCLDQA